MQGVAPQLERSVSRTFAWASSRLQLLSHNVRMRTGRKKQQLQGLRRRAALLDRTIALLEKLQVELANEAPKEIFAEENGILCLVARDELVKAAPGRPRSRPRTGQLLVFPSSGR
jgi:hypothetical protein